MTHCLAHIVTGSAQAICEERDVSLYPSPPLPVKPKQITTVEKGKRVPQSSHGLGEAIARQRIGVEKWIRNFYRLGKTPKNPWSHHTGETGIAIRRGCSWKQWVEWGRRDLQDLERVTVIEALLFLWPRCGPRFCPLVGQAGKEPGRQQLSRSGASTGWGWFVSPSARMQTS